MSVPAIGTWRDSIYARAEKIRADRLAKEEARLAARTPAEIRFDEHVKRIVDAAPPLSPGQAARIASILQSVPERNPMPEKEPSRPTLSKKALNPSPGHLYAPHLRASPDACTLCHKVANREVDHCHDHSVVRGLLCRGCNSLAEKNMPESYRRLCQYCAWEIWIVREENR